MDSPQSPPRGATWRKTVATVKGPDEYLEQADTDNSGGISLSELGVLLRDILPHAFTQDGERFKTFVEHEMKVADLDMDGLLNRDEFYMYYYSTLCFDLPPNIEMPNGESSNPGEELFRIYAAYCSYGHSDWSDEMDSKIFMRLCKNSGLIDKVSTMRTDSSVLSKQNLDLIFAKVKANRVTKREMGANRIHFQQFLEVLTRMAQRKKVGVSVIIQKILDHGAPKAQLMSPMGFFEVLDPPTGGPAGTFARQRVQNKVPVEVFKIAMPGRSWSRNIVSDFIDWNARDNSGSLCRESLWKSGIWRGGSTFRGGDLPSLEGCSSPVATFRPPRPPRGPGTAKDRIESIPWWTARNMTWEEMLPELKDIFMAYNQTQSPPTIHEMSAQTFVQVCVDSRLVLKGEMKPGHAMQIYRKVQGGRIKPSRKIPGQEGKRTPAPSSTMNINQFIQCLREVASLRRLALNEAFEMILVAGAPRPDGYETPDDEPPPPPYTPSNNSSGNKSGSGSSSPGPASDGGPKPQPGVGPLPSRYDKRYANGGLEDSLRTEEGEQAVEEDYVDDEEWSDGEDGGVDEGRGVDGADSAPRRLDFTHSGGALSERGSSKGRPASGRSSRRSRDVGSSKGGSRTGSVSASPRGVPMLGGVSTEQLNREVSEELSSAGRAKKEGSRRGTKDDSQDITTPPSREDSVRSSSRRVSREVSQKGMAASAKEENKDGPQEISTPPSREGSVRSSRRGSKGNSQEIASPPSREGSVRSGSRRVSREASQKGMAASAKEENKDGPHQEISTPLSQEGSVRSSRRGSKGNSQEIVSPPSREGSVRSGSRRVSREVSQKGEAPSGKEGNSQEIVTPPSREGSVRGSGSSRRVSRQGSQKGAGSVGKEGSQEIGAPLGKENSARSSRRGSKEVSQEIATPPSKQASREVSQEIGGPTSRKASENVSQEVGAPPAEQASMQGSLGGSELGDSGDGGGSQMELRGGMGSEFSGEAADDESIEAYGDDAEDDSGRESADGF